MKTAVEWMVEKLFRPMNNPPIENVSDIIEQAKQLEKQQIIDACNQEECFGSYGYENYEDITKGEEYYNLKFKNK